MAKSKPQTSYAEILASIEGIDDLNIYANWILVGIWIRPEKTASGIYLADKTLDEDKWQGKTGFVLKKGPLAFVSDAQTDFRDQDVKPGDCVVYRNSDGWSIDIRGVHCRMVQDTDIKMTVSDPAAIY
jgi:co-chaperonin GroES (HSP10)